MNGFSEFFLNLLLVIVGFVAGIIDSVAGGGGLITVPTLSIAIGPGALAIGTNKVAAVCSSLFALLVYLRGGHVEIKGHRRFALLTGVGALLGAMLSPHIPPPAYRWILLTVCPVILWVVYRKDLWAKAKVQQIVEDPNGAEPSSDGTMPKASHARCLLWAAGFACGFYDGIAGPGGGTLMFLSLFLVAKVPLLTAMATAKIANLSSASVSLASFAVTGHVLWTKGLWVALGISTGALIGANFATRNAAPVARAMLLVLASLLLIRLLFT